MLEEAQIEQYKTQGFLVLNNFASKDECQAMRDRAAALVANSDSTVDPRGLFDSKYIAKRLVSYSYFLESTNGISLFFEKSAVDADGKLLMDKNRAIIKIGHALHDCDPVFEKYSHSSKMHEIARALGYKKPMIGQSRYFFKPPEFGAAIPPHQDSDMLYTEPLSCTALWLALEKATLENGCLWVSPGSHLAGLRCRYIRDHVTGIDERVSLGNFEPIKGSSFIPLEVEEGTLILMSGELFHKSNKNSTKNTRQAYGLHFFEGHESYKFPAENWVQCPGGFGALRHLEAQN